MRQWHGLRVASHLDLNVSINQIPISHSAQETGFAEQVPRRDARCDFGLLRRRDQSEVESSTHPRKGEERADPLPVAEQASSCQILADRKSEPIGEVELPSPLHCGRAGSATLAFECIGADWPGRLPG